MHGIERSTHRLRRQGSNTFDNAKSSFQGSFSEAFDRFFKEVSHSVRDSSEKLDWVADDVRRERNSQNCLGQLAGVPVCELSNDPTPAIEDSIQLNTNQSQWRIVEVCERAAEKGFEVRDQYMRAFRRFDMMVGQVDENWVES